jgi:hypothetical protein
MSLKMAYPPLNRSFHSAELIFLSILNTTHIPFFSSAICPPFGSKSFYEKSGFHINLQSSYLSLFSTMDLPVASMDNMMRVAVYNYSCNEIDYKMFVWVISIIKYDVYRIQFNSYFQGGNEQEGVTS